MNAKRVAIGFSFCSSVLLRLFFIVNKGVDYLIIMPNIGGGGLKFFWRVGHSVFFGGVITNIWAVAPPPPQLLHKPNQDS